MVDKQPAKKLSKLNLEKAESLGVTLSSSQLNWYDLETKC